MTRSPVTVEVEGAARLRSALKAMGDDLADLKDANAGAASLVATEAAARAPRRSGALAGSGRGNRAAGRATVMFGGARVPYAGPIHWGWAERGIEAHPFVVDAAVATESQWLGLYQDGIDAAVARVGGTY